MIKRQRFPKLPTQGNYYPMAASTYIEDKKFRLTVATAQPLGVSSMASGQIEVCILYVIYSYKNIVILQYIKYFYTDNAR